MSLEYFYCPPEHISNGIVTIEGEEYTHLTRVLRKQEGERIRVVNGEGVAYDVQLVSLNKKVAEGKILDSYQNHNEAEQHVAIAVGLLKNPSRYDFLIEKVTELGVKEIIPLTTSRTISFHAKTERWQKLALAAMKQSCRSYLPRISETISLDALLGKVQNYEWKIIFHEKATQLFTKNQDEHNGKVSTLILIGPEGGFSDEEVEQCVKIGCSLYSLGERRLRTETAAIVAVSRVLI